MTRTSNGTRLLPRLRTFFLTLTLTAVAAADDAPTVTVLEGQLQGKRQGQVDTFLGIPYAEAPIGELRWKSPKDATPWRGIRAAHEFGANCIQPLGQGTVGPWTHEYVVTDNFDEDCLFLNIWRPSNYSTSGNLPVLVWIHGGGFTAGSGSVPIYNGYNLATTGIIVVTLNYRLGPLGFLALPELTLEAAGGAVSNFGIQDQIKALKWLRDNVAAFGGDPTRVTIAGQSAGSMAVHTLIASPMAAGLFHQAIAQAGLPSAAMAPALATAEQNGLEYMKTLDVSNLADLRALEPERFLPKPGQPRLPFRFGVTVDNKLLPRDPAAMLVAGESNDVAVIIGRNADENLGLFTPPATGTSEAEWRAALELKFTDSVNGFLPLYAAQTDRARSEALSQMRRDNGLATMWLWAEKHAKKYNSPIYLYMFDHVEPGPNSDQWRSFHSSEIPYIFGTLDKAPERGFTFADWRASMTASSLWSSFVKTGVPKVDLAESWPAFDIEEPQIMRIAETVTVAPLMTREKRYLYRQYVEQGGQLSQF